jgi:hypothetical protein
MSHLLVPIELALLLCTASLQATEGPRRGKINRIDLERKILSLVVDDKSIDAAPKPVIGSYGATLIPKMPVGAVVVPDLEGALAKAIGSHGNDTVFYLKAGVHTGNGEMRPKAGSVFVGEKGAILDGGNATTKCFIHDVGVIP